MPRSKGDNLDGRLDEVHQTIVAGQPRGALLGLLEVWPQLRSDAVAAAIEALSAKLTRARGAIPQGKSQKANLEAFMLVAAEQDPADVGRLRDDFCAAFRDSSQVVLSPRMDALSTFAPDPRLGLPLGQLLARPIYHQLRGHAGKKLWTRMFAVLQRSQDPRLVPFLREVATTFTGDSHAVTTWFRAKADKMVAALAKLSVDHEPREQLVAIQRAIDALGDAVDEAAPVAAPAAEEGPLLEQALADPNDDGVRMVLADVWQQRGDPRGELIALQLARKEGASSKKGERREAALIKANLDTWLGALAKAVQPGGVTFEGGFLATVWMRKTAVRAVGTLRDLDAWRTVHTIYFQNRSFFSPKMTSLRHAFGVCASGLEELARHDRSPLLETLTLADYITAGELDPARFSGLRELGFGVQTRRPEEALARSPLAAQLETLIMASAPDIRSWLPGLQDFPPIAVRFVSAPWTKRRGGTGWFVTVSPSGGDWSRMHVVLDYSGAVNDTYTQELLRLLEGLLPSVDKLAHIDFRLPPPTAVSSGLLKMVGELVAAGAVLPAEWQHPASSM